MSLLFLFLLFSGVHGQALTFLNTQTTITCASILLQWRGGIQPYQLIQQIPGLPDHQSDLGNTQSHIFIPDFMQVLAGDQFTLTIKDSDGNSTTKQFASSTEKCKGAADAVNAPGFKKSFSQVSPSNTHSFSSSDTHTTATTGSISLSSGSSTTTTSSVASPSPSLTATSSPSLLPSSSPSPPSPSSKSSTSISTATHPPSSNKVLIGGIVGGLALLALLSLAALCYFCKLRPRQLARRRFAVLDTECSSGRNSRAVNPFAIVSPGPASASASGVGFSPESKENENPFDDSNSPTPTPITTTTIFEERLKKDKRDRQKGESTVPAISLVYNSDSDSDSLKSMDVMTMRRRMDLLLAENAKLDNTRLVGSKSSSMGSVGSGGSSPAPSYLSYLAASGGDVRALFS
ncbi:hypothetical protein BDP27DRAFT_1338344 [Rhodocollybia butyracea]|uniref:Mid2 domain-containing protein n=1 Tax=Rhodocollybia butyracea TaxID=206335 RepID=A0A9P5PFP5_9AGAR|nr:hypothetical protein BDP27DRAFT_1338344 [Rhodocollybia butyracea]